MICLSPGCQVVTIRKAVLDTDVKMKIFVKTSSGKTFALDVGSGDTLDAVKQKIQEERGISSEQHRLVLDGDKLEAGCTVHIQGIRDVVMGLQRKFDAGKPTEQAPDPTKSPRSSLPLPLLLAAHLAHPSNARVLPPLLAAARLAPHSVALSAAEQSHMLAPRTLLPKLAGTTLVVGALVLT